MRKISELIMQQANTEFRAKRKEIIKEILAKSSKSEEEFNELLNLYKIS